MKVSLEKAKTWVFESWGGKRLKFRNPVGQKHEKNECWNFAQHFLHYALCIIIEACKKNLIFHLMFYNMTMTSYVNDFSCEGKLNMNLILEKAARNKKHSFCFFGVTAEERENTTQHNTTGLQETRWILRLYGKSCGRFSRVPVQIT